MTGYYLQLKISFFSVCKFALFSSGLIEDCKAVDLKGRKGNERRAKAGGTIKQSLKYGDKGLGYLCLIKLPHGTNSKSKQWVVKIGMTRVQQNSLKLQ